MFKSARFKLTGWYIGILFVILSLFSGVIYRVGSIEIERSYSMAYMRSKTQGMGASFSRPMFKRFDFFNYKIEDLEIEECQADILLAKRFLLENILAINFIILLISAFLSYFLAGKTLAPIEKMVKRQEVFLSDASHELRTPLTAIQTSLEVTLRDKKIKRDDAIKVLRDNLKDIKLLKGLSEKLLTLASYEENSNKLFISKISSLVLADDVLENFKAIAKKKKIKLESQVEEKELYLDESKIKQLMAILIDNAIKYSPKNSKVKLSIKTSKKELIIELKDQGQGIPADDLNQIFDRFYRSDKVRQKEFDHSFGLGLSIAKKIVDLHKGQITVKTELNKGTNFIVKLPLFSKNKIFIS